VPLYVVLSEANPRAEAGRAVIISRATGRSKTIDLSDSAALNELISHGDIINITARPQEFFYIGGQINAPGQKDFHPGMTLTQAILASGGVARVAGSKVKVTVSRQGADGRLVATEFPVERHRDRASARPAFAGGRPRGSRPPPLAARARRRGESFGSCPVRVKVV
jgi:protein involved in polysaccharide export with SLBB domain